MLKIKEYSEKDTIGLVCYRLPVYGLSMLAM